MSPIERGRVVRLMGRRNREAPSNLAKAMTRLERRFDPDVPELMDRPSPLTDEWRRDLANLRSLNRHFGAYRIVRWFLRPRIRPGGTYRILDLATGSADIPREIVDFARGRGVRVEIDAVERHPATLRVAEEYCAGHPEIRLREGDVRDAAAIPGVEPGRYDFVLCSLALHHFTSEDAVRVLAGMRALAGTAALVADLERSLAAVAGIRLVTATIYRDPMTVADARASAVAAFSRAELEAMAESAGWTPRCHRRFFYGRQAIVWERRGETDWCLRQGEDRAGSSASSEAGAAGRLSCQETPNRSWTQPNLRLKP